VHPRPYPTSLHKPFKTEKKKNISRDAEKEIAPRTNSSPCGVFSFAIIIFHRNDDLMPRVPSFPCEAYICVSSVYLFKLALLIIVLKCTILIFRLMLSLRLDKSRSCERWKLNYSRSSSTMNIQLMVLCFCSLLKAGHCCRDNEAVKGSSFN
jgi:hypothetical protein